MEASASGTWTALNAVAHEILAFNLQSVNGNLRENWLGAVQLGLVLPARAEGHFAVKRPDGRDLGRILVWFRILNVDPWD